MCNFAKIIIIVSVFLIGTVSVVLCQSHEYLDNIKIIAVKTIHVQTRNDSTFLNTTIQIHNVSSKKLKLYDGIFRFYIQLKNEKKELIGIDKVSRDIILEHFEVLAKNKDHKETNDIEFQINMGNDQMEVSNSLMKILNAVGKPEDYKPIIYIEGEFRLGVKSDKGWTNLPQKISWIFRPDVHRYVLLEGRYGTTPVTSEEIISIFLPKTDSKMRTDTEFHLSKGTDKVAWNQGVTETDTGTDKVAWNQGVTETDTGTDKVAGNQGFTETGTENGTDTATYIEDSISVPVYIKFDYESSEIRPESCPILDIWGKALNDPRLADSVFWINGHACSIGSKEYNLKLSEKRAKSVRQYLIKKHAISPDRLKVRGFGNEKPLTSNDTPERRAVNRRVEFERIR